MASPWMEHPKLIAWFDDLEDAVATAFALTDEQRAGVRALRAPRADTWMMLARDTHTRDTLRKRLSEAQRRMPVPVACDCDVLAEREGFSGEEDSFDRENGFGCIEIDYIEEGSAEEIRRDLLADADDYAASEEAGWFYAITDSDHDTGTCDPE